MFVVTSPPATYTVTMDIDRPSTAALSSAAPALMPFLARDDVLAFSCSARWLLDCYRTKSKKLVLLRRQQQQQQQEEEEEEQQQ